MCRRFYERNRWCASQFYYNLLSLGSENMGRKKETHIATDEKLFAYNCVLSIIICFAQKLTVLSGISILHSYNNKEQFVDTTNLRLDNIILQNTIIL
jgi:hypothetical protein